MTAVSDPLENMTQQRWDLLSPADKARIRSDAGLSPQLVGLEGKRVEVETTYGEKRRFYVGRSTGWVPCHIERKLRTSDGGMAAERSYKSVRELRKPK